MNILELSHVSKSFGSKMVVDDISFAVQEGSVFGFIGQNGAGKTTTMKMILGLLQPDRGEIFVNGEKVSFGQNQTNQYIGYLPDVPEFYGFMTPKEYLFLCGEITGLDKTSICHRVDELLEMVGLTEADKRIQGFSRGMKQRLGIAQALLHSPKLLICDEPTSALDPVGRKEILDILSNVKKETTVVFSTHILSDVERICEKIAFLHNGEIALSGGLEEIKSIRGGSGLELEFCKPEDALQFAQMYSGAHCLNQVRLRYDKKKKDDVLEIMKILTEHNIPIQRMEMLEPNLEDLFMEVVGK
ncbi:MAG: ABC transporter ATP-binding protein [Lachnospiraceae bacterium]|nr:ABC transporter ATP-binding protein [Lachnospiraceae bacterium]